MFRLCLSPTDKAMPVIVILSYMFQSVNNRKMNLIIVNTPAVDPSLLMNVL